MSPLQIKAKGRKIALIARTSVFVASPCYADHKTPGVARFDLQETTSALKSCRDHADIVILLLHWGLENYRFPTPSQRRLAKQLIGAGADFIVGHHPHVLQGIESVGSGSVAYSLGNFMFDHFPWRFSNHDGDMQEKEMRLTPLQLKAGILTLDQKIGFIPTRIEKNTLVLTDTNPRRQKEIRWLSMPFSLPAYGFFWRFYALEREWRLRILPLARGRLNWEKLKKIQIRHFIQLFKTLQRSAGITRGKSTNPYE
jgi:hypothetical protein